MSAPQTSDMVAAFAETVAQSLSQNRPDLVSDADLSRLLRDALRLYAFKADKAGHFLPPYDNGALSATETVVAATGIIRAADMNLWDLAMWFNRADAAPTRNDGGREG